MVPLSVGPFCRSANSIFDSLEDKLKHDVNGVVLAVLSVLLFGGLYFAVRTAESAESWAAR